MARRSFFQPDVSSESATTSLKGYTDGCKSGNEAIQRSDDVTIAGKRRIKLPVQMDKRTFRLIKNCHLYSTRKVSLAVLDILPNFRAF